MAKRLRLGFFVCFDQIKPTQLFLRGRLQDCPKKDTTYIFWTGASSIVFTLFWPKQRHDL